MILILIGSCFTAFAENDGFTIIELSEDKKQSFIDYLDIELLTTEPERKAINCFNISADGQIAIGCSHSGASKSISVYDTEFNFLYGYTFYSESSFGIDWEGENILIYIVRAEKIISLTANGTILDVLGVDYDQKTDSYLRNVIDATERTYKGRVYSLSNDFLGVFHPGAYTKLEVSDTNGNSEILYDASYGVGVYIFISIFIAVLTGGFVIALVMTIKKRAAQLKAR